MSSLQQLIREIFYNNKKQKIDNFGAKPELWNRFNSDFKLYVFEIIDPKTRINTIKTNDWWGKEKYNNI